MKKNSIIYLAAILFLCNTLSCSETGENKNEYKSIYVIIKDTDLFTNRIGDSRFALIRHYRERYGVKELTKKITNNHGNGFDSLYGTRNMRPVLHGIWYRGGANNAFHKRRKRDNRNPLPNDGLKNLARDGFSRAYYLYSTRFSKAKKSVVYDTTKPAMPYFMNNVPDRKRMRELVVEAYKVMLSDSLGPIYAHCWNGWHQTGFVSTLMLRQFCDFTPQQALQYWNICTDGVNKGYDHIKKAILNYEPFDGFEISANLKEEICPCMEYQGRTIPEINREFIAIPGFNESMITFEPGAVEFNSSSKDALDSLARFLKQNDFLKIEVQGHTDNSGEASSNLNISRKRAKNVYNYLISNGVAEKNISYRGYGQKNPKFDNSTREGRDKNRRIEFSIIDINMQAHLNKDSFDLGENNTTKLNLIKVILDMNPNLMIEVEYHNDDIENKKIDLKKAEEWGKSFYLYLLNRVKGKQVVYDGDN